jgi:arsenical pump membrane protein
MLTLQVILALLAAGVLVAGPRSVRGALVLVALAALDVSLGATARPAITVVAPLFAFLAAALALAASVERAGLAHRAAAIISAGSRSTSLRLYVRACLLCALLTAIVTLDGAIVLMIPVVTSLTRTRRALFAPLFLGVVTVANAVSIAVPQGNPTNLVLISRLHLTPSAYLGHMLAPGLAAGAVCAALVAVLERRALEATPPVAPTSLPPLSRVEHRAGLALVAAALTGWLAPLAGIAPWWPFVAVVALGFVLRRERPPLLLPWRIVAQVGALLVTFGALARHLPAASIAGLAGLAVLAIAIGAVAAIANNLPASVLASGLLSGGSAAYAASIGLAVGALATPQGSVATLLAGDLAGAKAPRMPFGRLAPLAAAATLTATALLWTTLG